MRRGSFMSGEPLIVVEESGGILEEEEEEGRQSDTNDSPSAPDSPSMNPYLLSPYRDMRKRSLPTPQCTTGITASQVRRLSEQGGEGGKGPSPMEAAFLATLSSAPAPTPGGRRHSVVTISRAPPTSVLFGRNRRESIAAFPTQGLPLSRFPRRDSSSSIARSPSVSGSNFNLQLDIMDDIAEIKAARKVRLKMWQTDSEEKICEVEPLDGAGSTARYHQKESRRFSDVTGIPPLQVQSRRRASELPRFQESGSATPPSDKPSGIVCSNSDLMCIMSSLTSSAQEINEPVVKPVVSPVVVPSKLEEKRNRLTSNRSNSFDVSLLPESKTDKTPVNWFLRRHLPMNKKDETPSPSKKKEKVLWDKPSGSLVDAKLIGSAIEVFLNKKTDTTPQEKKKTSWFGAETKETDDEVSCDNSLCSTLKDLFVK